MAEVKSRFLVCHTLLEDWNTIGCNPNMSLYNTAMKRTILRDALRIAKEKLGNHPQFSNFPHYTFIVQFNKIVEWATNSVGVPPKHFGYHDRLSHLDEALPKMHAEFNAWKKARGVLDVTKPFEVINIRLNRSGDSKMSAPCSCCKGFLTEMGCTTFYFTTESGWAKII